MAKHTNAARRAIIESGVEHEKTIQEIISAGDSGYGVGDRTADAIDRLHRRPAR
jgi:hypothetical protein